MGVRKNIYFKDANVIDKLEALQDREKSKYVEQCIIKDIVSPESANATKSDIEAVNQNVLELTEAIYTLTDILSKHRH